MLENSTTTAAHSGQVNELRLPAADGGRIHCISAGTGSTVLLARGFLLDPWLGATELNQAAKHNVCPCADKG